MAQCGMPAQDEEDEIPTPRLGPAAMMQMQWSQYAFPQISHGLEEQLQEEEGRQTPCLGPMDMMPYVAITKCSLSHDVDAVPPPPNPFQAPSRGSCGHPYNCAPACKYASKKRGCKDGAACDHC